MKFIHTADLHLDARLESNLTLEQARTRRRELLETFRTILRIASQNQVTAILCAGDLFDSTRVSEKTRELIAAEISAHPEITFLYLRGNHDAGFGQGSLPENLKTFRSEDGWVSYRFGEVVVTATEHNADPELYGKLQLAEEDVNIVMMHGQESASGTLPGEDLVCLRALKNKNIDYLALGHIHSAKTGKLDKRGIYAYSGCPDGRGFDECGEKGIWLIEVTEDKKTVTSFIPTSTRVFRTVPVDVGGLVAYPEIEAAMLGALSGIDEKDAVRVELTGERDPDARIDTEHLADVLKSRFWLARIKDHTVLALRPEDYAGDISLKGEFIRVVEAARMKQEEKDLVILTGLRALRGEDSER